jgi:hypothetical protein
MDLNKMFSIVTAISIVLTGIYFTLLLLLISLTVKADVILLTVYHDAASTNEGGSMNADQ